MTNEQTAIRTTYFSIVGNTCLAGLKWMTGYFGNSYALIADAIESTTDIFSSFLVLFGLKYSNRPADSNHPYGHGKAEPLVTFAVVGFLLVSATIIAVESIRNLGEVQEKPELKLLINYPNKFKKEFYKFNIELKFLIYVGKNGKLKIK